MSVTLKGLAWDHRRCWGPLDASIPAWRAAHPGVEIRWDRRSLYEFGEGRLDEAVKTHDLVVFDHPFVGEIARDGLLVPLDPYLDAETTRAFAADSVGKSWQSYQADGRQWALPIDAAAQVAAYRPDLMAAFADAPPRTHDEVVALGRKVAASGKRLGLPLVPTDAMCLIITGAGIDGTHDRRIAGGLPRPRRRRRNRRPPARARGAVSPVVVVVESDPLLRPHDRP